MSARAEIRWSHHRVGAILECKIMENYRMSIWRIGDRRSSGRWAFATVMAIVTCGLSADRCWAAQTAGTCCHQGACLQATYWGNGYWECNGILQPMPFGGSCQGSGACYLFNGTCTVRDGRCCSGEFVPGAPCEDPKACCNTTTYGLCSVDPPALCIQDGNVPMDDDDCAEAPCGVRTCCLPEEGAHDFCENYTYLFCLDEGGEPQAIGSLACESGSFDGDSVHDLCDNCPSDPNNDQADFDQCVDSSDPTNITDGCDSDADCDLGFYCGGDGIGDECDNCLDLIEADQTPWAM